MTFALQSAWAVGEISGNFIARCKALQSGREPPKGNITRPTRRLGQADEEAWQCDEKQREKETPLISAIDDANPHYEGQISRAFPQNVLRIQSFSHELQAFNGMPARLLRARTILNRLATGNKQSIIFFFTGKIFALVASAEALVPIVASLLYSKLYSATLDLFIGTFYLLSSAILFLVGSMYMWALPFTHFPTDLHVDVDDDVMDSKHDNVLNLW